ncbi:hypothetical protein CL621_02865 [archaeon]|nr:hypothetical protein [archaeon]|tara:strand:- start:135 stop:632 length:498 start_codon:yes stop_codon:yes gene_type:complete
MKITILDKAKKKKFIEAVSYLGVEKISQMLIKTGNERLRVFSGSLSNEELMALWRLFPIEGVGLYFGKEMVYKKTGEKETRLSLDALHVLKKQIKGNIIELDEKQEGEWFKGGNLEFDEGETNKRGFVAVKSKKSGDFIGTGKISNKGETLLNFLPKERWRKEKL